MVLSESNLPLLVELFVGLVDFLVAVAPQIAHPLGIGVDIVSPGHVDDLIGILLSKLVLELLLELCVFVTHSCCQVG